MYKTNISAKIKREYGFWNGIGGHTVITDAAVEDGGIIWTSP